MESFKELPKEEIDPRLEESDLARAQRSELAGESVEGLLEKWSSKLSTLKAYETLSGECPTEENKRMLNIMHVELSELEKALLSQEDLAIALETVVNERKSLYERDVNQGLTGAHVRESYETDMARYEELASKIASQSHE